MTQEQINEQLIKDVETAVNNVVNAYNGSFKIKKSDEGTDRVSNFTLRLSSSEWNKDAQIKFSIDKPSEYVGDADDPTYYAACEMGMRVNFYDGFVGTKHSIDIMGKPSKENVGKFIEEIFLPTSIEILKFAKANKRKYPSIIVKKLKDFYKDMWKGTIKKVPTEEQIEQLFTNEQTNESKLVDEAAKPESKMKPYNKTYALQEYLAEELEKVSFKRNDFVVLTLGSKSQLDSIKDAVIDALGKEALQEKPGITTLFILLKNMTKEEAVKGINKLEFFGECSEEDIVEFNRKDHQYFIVKVEFA